VGEVGAEPDAAASAIAGLAACRVAFAREEARAALGFVSCTSLLAVDPALVVVEPAGPVLAVELALVVEPAGRVLECRLLALVEPTGPVLAVRDVVLAAIEPTESVVAADNIALAAIEFAEPILATDAISPGSGAPATHASTLEAPAEIDAAAGGTNRSTPATAARFSSSPTLE
jgi:hypothetical protein